MKTFIFWGLLFASLGGLQAQKEGNNWVFSNNKINFNTAPLTVDSTQTWIAITPHQENQTALSDSVGNLIAYFRCKALVPFYGRQGSVYNRHEEVMDNGGDVVGFYTTTNGSILLPGRDGNSACLFTLGNADVQINEFAFCTGVYLSKIEFSSNCPDGCVTLKNFPLYEGWNLQEKIAAVRHSDGKRWWLVTHTATGDTFVKFLFDGQEISEPIFQPIGAYCSPWSEYLGEKSIGAGEISVSFNGKKLAMSDVTGGIVQVLSINRCDGTLHSPVFVTPHQYDYTPGQAYTPPLSNQYYGCELSPDGTKLYLTRLFQELIFIVTFLEVVDLNNFPINRVTLNTLNSLGGQLQVGPDEKMYLAGAFPYTSAITVEIEDSNRRCLGIIHNPNASAEELQIDYCGYFMPQWVFGGLPNMPNYALGPLYENPAGEDAYYCQDITLLGKTNDVDTSIYHPIYEWVPCVGLSCCDCERPLAYPETTTQYTLRVVVEGGCEFFDSVTVAVENVSLPMLQDTSVCQGKSFIMPRGSGIYNWSPAVIETETSFVFTPLETTTYTLSYSETGNCFAVDSFRITVIPRYISVGGFEASYPDTFDSPPFSVRFSSLTSGADSSLFVWYFGDSTSAIGLGNPVHAYPDTGQYVVSFVMLPPPGYCGASVYSDTIRLAMRDTTDKDTTSRTPPLLEGGQGGGVRVYPNPAQDEVRIFSEHANCTLSLYDATGKQILGDVQVFAGVETKLSTKHLPEGVYFVKFRGDLRTGYAALVVAR